MADDLLKYKFSVIQKKKKKFPRDFVEKLPVKKKKCSENPIPVVTNKLIEKERVIGNFLNCYQNGNILNSKLQKVAEKAVIKEIKSFNCLPFSSCTKLDTDSRITALKWHPHNNNLFVFGSKRGSLFMGEVRDGMPKLLKFFIGSGIGNRIQTIVFDQFACENIYTADEYGRIGTWNITKEHLSPSFEFETHFCKWNWYSSLDISADCKTLFTGDNKGQFLTMDLKSQKIEVVKLHKSKITHIEHCKRNPQLIVTSSLDKTVKLWDRRMMDKMDRFLANLEHSCAVNNAEFSLSDSNRLLTTDQMKQLRVYKAPNWNLETLIPHPHRMVQVVTQTKASWHPLVDIIVIGRYPDDSFSDPTCDEMRSIDFYSATSGKILYQMYEPMYKGITSLTRFNRSGNILLSAMGQHPMLWYTDALKVTERMLKKKSRK